MAPNCFARLASEISLTQSTHQIAVSKSSGRLRHAWWPKFGRFDPLEGVILGESAGISQISGVPGLADVVNIFLSLVE